VDTTQITRHTTLCISLAGRPSNVGTRFHNHLYRELGLDYVYKAFTTSDLPGAVAGIRALGIRGCGVSMPFKEAVIPLIDSLDDSARAISSVNTLVNTAGELRAYNTDYLALVSLLRSHEVLGGSSFVVLGSGGMARADVGAGRPALVVNATPVGMAGGPFSGDLPVSPDVIDSARWVLEVVAMPVDTPLVRRARAVGAQVISGSEVMALQAAEQFVLYTGIRPTPEQLARAVAFSRAEPSPPHL
jgi:shikimate dehydrogenase